MSLPTGAEIANAQGAVVRAQDDVARAWDDVARAEQALQFATQLRDYATRKLENAIDDLNAIESAAAGSSAAAGLGAAAAGSSTSVPEPTPPPTRPFDHFSRLEQMEGCYFATMTKESARDFIKPVAEDRLRFVVYPNPDKQKEKGYIRQVFRATYRNYRDDLTHMDFCRSPDGLCHDDKCGPADCHPTVTAYLDSRLQTYGRTYGNLLRPWPPTAGAQLSGDVAADVLQIPSAPVNPVRPATYLRYPAVVAPLPAPAYMTLLPPSYPNAWVPAPAASAYKKQTSVNTSVDTSVDTPVVTQL